MDDGSAMTGYYPWPLIPVNLWIYTYGYPSVSFPAVVPGFTKKTSYISVHPRYLFDLKNIRFRLQIQSLIQSFILKSDTTLIFLYPSMTAGTFT